jgi:hypothetical protein
MRKILFVCNDINIHPTTGGEKGTRNNYELLQKVFGEEQTSFIKLFGKKPNSLQRKINWIKYGHSHVDKSQVHRLYAIADQFDMIFFDNSYLGNVVRKIKQKHPSIHLVSFFQNVESDFVREAFKHKYFLTRFFIYKGTDANEKNTCLYADALIALNERDKKRIVALYGRTADFILPVNMPDTLDAVDYNREGRISNQITFVGSHFFANVSAVLWFVENVLDRVDIRFIIAGRDMDKLPEHLRNHPKIQIYANVPDLTAIYEMTDLIVSPIFEGSGMKVKTCEALTYGKTIIGSKEAFEGYSITPDVGTECNTSDQYVDAINRFFLDKDRKRFNENARNLFLDKYERQAIILRFHNFIMSLFPQ